MDEVTREIRQILIGNIIPKGRYYEVPEKGIAGIRTGLNDSADMILLFGVARHTRYYKVTGNPNKIKAEGHKSLMNIGRKVIIRSNPNAEVSFCRYMVTRPIVILFEVDDIGAKVQTFTSRGISGLISEAWIRWKFMKELPELERIDRATLNEIYRQRAEEEKKAKEEQKKAEEEAKKKEEEEKKKAEEERKKQEALDALENTELSDEDIEAIIAARRKKKKGIKNIPEISEEIIEENSEVDIVNEENLNSELVNEVVTENTVEDYLEEISEELQLETNEEPVSDIDLNIVDTEASAGIDLHIVEPQPAAKHSGGQKVPGLRGAKKRFKRAPKLSETDELKDE